MKSLCFIIVLSVCALEVFGFKSAEKDVWDALKGSTGDVIFKPGVSKQAINLTMGLQLITLSDYEDTKSTIRVGYWMSMYWTIPGATWEPQKYNGIHNIKVPKDKLWVPDIVPYKHTEFEHAKQSHIIIFNNGHAMWVPHLMSSFLCENKKDGPKYPRDQKVCTVTIGSWVYDGYTLNLTQKKGEELMSELDWKPLESSGWKFLNATTKYQVKHYPCCPEPYPSVVLKIYIERSDIYFGLALSVPGVVVGLIIALLYLVPPTSPARITSQCICLLVIVFVGVTDMRLMGSTVLMAPAAHYFMAAMVIDLMAILWSILMSVTWMQASVKGPHARGAMDSWLSKLECICCLPSFMVQQDHQQLDLDLDDRSEDNNVRMRVVGLSSVQRFALVLDRLFSVGSIVLLLFLFIYLGV